MCNHFYVSVLLILSFTWTATAQLSQTERSIAERAEVQTEYSLDLLERAININSGTMNFEGVKKVGDLFREEFDQLGFETEWVDGAGFGRAGHLVARQKGSGLKMLLIGHLDTVFELDSPFQEMKLLNDSTAHGPGIADMKGGNVIIVSALRALQEAGQLGGLDITIVMTGDEERSGSPIAEARKALTDAAERADVALAFENSDGDPRTAVVSRRGSTSWTLEVTGKPAHSSQIFKSTVGAGAIYEASRILTQFYEQLSTVENLTFNPGVILGGTTVDYDATQSRGEAFGKNNVVAEVSTISGDLRAISPEQLEMAKASMQAIVADHLPGTEATLTFRDSYPPLAPTDGNYKLLSMYDEVSQDLGLGPVGPVDPRNAGAADVSFTAGLVDMAIDGMGLGGADDHTVDETGDLWTLPIQTKRAAVLIYRLGSKTPDD